MIQLLQFVLIGSLALVTLHLAYLMGRASADERLDHAYREYTRVANRLAAIEGGRRREP